MQQPPTVRCLRLKVGEMPAGGCRYIRLQLGRRHAGAGLGGGAGAIQVAIKCEFDVRLEVLSRSPALA